MGCADRDGLARSHVREENLFLPPIIIIAAHTGVTQNTVARIFTQLYKLKVIGRYRNDIFVLNLSYLENVMLSRRLR